MSELLRQLGQRLNRSGLDILGGFHPSSDDQAPEGTKTLILIGPNKAFWEVFTGSDEFRTGCEDPVDRWSTRVLEEAANAFDGRAVFPFGGEPYLPFYSWALKSGRVWSSPIKLAVHDTHGLFVSFRGAICLNEHVELNSAGTRPCDACPQPCLNACPVNAISLDGYDVAACKSYLKTKDGQDCMKNGCLARRACPVGQGLRDPAQSAYHMQVFSTG